MESPESAQPKLEMQAGSYSAAALMSWPAARNALVGEAEAVTVGETDGAAAGEAEAGDAGAEGEPAELAELAVATAPLAGLEAGAAAELVAELQAVSSKAAPASSAPAAIGLALRAFVVNINSRPLGSLRLGEPPHLYDVWRAAVVGSSVARTVTSTRRSADRTDPR